MVVEQLGTLQVMKTDGEDELYDSRIFNVITSAGDGNPDVRIEVEHKGRFYMFRFKPDALMAALAKSLMDPEE